MAETCESMGPRIGSEVPVCVLTRYHTSQHAAHPSWGDVHWSDKFFSGEHNCEARSWVPRDAPARQPLAGDLIITWLPAHEPAPSGWTSLPDHVGAYWRIATGREHGYPPVLAIVTPPTS